MPASLAEHRKLLHGNFQLMLPPPERATFLRLLASQLVFAGQGYCFALARLGTQWATPNRAGIIGPKERFGTLCSLVEEAVRAARGA